MEIQPNELRIGNYVYENYGGVYQVSIINSTDDHYGLCKTGINMVGRYNLEQLNPISLTEEWLYRFGFLYIENEWYINGKQWLMQVSDDYVDENDFINRDGTWFDGIGTHSFHKYGHMVVNALCRGNYICGAVGTVHKLQNLYFALNGKELKPNIA